MTFQDIVGTYTYRSFLNLETGDPGDLLWAEGELFLGIEPDGAVTGHLAFPADTAAPKKAVLDILGRASNPEMPELTLTASGRPGTSAAEFQYSYRCWPGRLWPGAEPAQRPSLVGTVIRDQDHGQARAGATASFVAVKRDFLEPRDVEAIALIPEAIDMLADETHRLRHTVWHTVRGVWTSDALSDAGRRKLRNLGWAIDDPPFRPEGVLNLENGAGEDFLYMHRRMIRMLGDVYTRQGKLPPVAWGTIPSGLAPQIAYRPETDPATGQVEFVIDPENSGFMAPPATLDFMRLTGQSDFLFFNKTAQGFRSNLSQLAARLRSPAFAAALPLGAYGNLIESTVHNWMHMRWASTPRDPEAGTASARATFDISPKWNARHYDYLGDFHSSHVNPVFWKLHGWVDDCIETWFSAHGALTPGQVTRTQVRGIDWFEQGPWVRKADPFDWPGAEGHGTHHHGHADELATLKEVMAVLESELSTADAIAGFQARAISGFAAMIDLVSEHGVQGRSAELEKEK